MIKVNRNLAPNNFTKTMTAPMKTYVRSTIRSRSPFTSALVSAAALAWLCTVPAVSLEGSERLPAWPQFRGPAASGIGSTDFPIHFGPESNVVWKTAVPAGHSSPSIFGDRIFLTGFQEGRLLTFCLDRRDGSMLWKRELTAGPIERGAHHGSPATATAVTDGERVWVYFGSFGLACYDVEGNERWLKPLPIPVTQHGAGTSPVLAGNLLILNSDQDVGSYLLAVDKRTGETLWRTERPGVRRGFSTPLPYPPEKPGQVIVAGTLRLVAYDLKDGKEVWSVHGLPNEMVSSPIAADGMIYVAGWTHGAGVPVLPDFDTLLAGDADKDGKLTRAEAPAGPARQHFVYIDADKDGFITREEWDTIVDIFYKSQNVLMAVRPGGSGDVTSTHVAWTQNRGLPYCPTPLHYKGKLYLVRNGGLASCFDGRTGQSYFQEERLGAMGDNYASPVAAAGKICVISQPGTAVILRAGETPEVLARNPLGEPVLATPAILDHTLYVRTQGHLYAFSERNPAGSAD
jgi:outer membrane protein assembly factor BamB